MDRYTIIIAVIALLAAVQRLLREDVKWFPSLASPFRGLVVAVLGILVAPIGDAVLNNANVVQAIVTGVISILPTVLNILAGLTANKSARKVASVAAGGVLMLTLTAGCAAAIPILTQVITAVQDASLIIDTIISIEKQFFSDKIDAATQAKIEDAIKKAQLALDVALRATRGAKGLSADQADAAFAEFRESYKSLVELLREAGVVVPLEGGRMLAARNGQARIPTPLAMERIVAQ